MRSGALSTISVAADRLTPTRSSAADRATSLRVARAESSPPPTATSMPRPARAAAAVNARLACGPTATAKTRVFSPSWLAMIASASASPANRPSVTMTTCRIAIEAPEQAQATPSSTERTSNKAPRRPPRRSTRAPRRDFARWRRPVAVGARALRRRTRREARSDRGRRARSTSADTAARAASSGSPRIEPLVSNRTTTSRGKRVDSMAAG